MNTGFQQQRPQGSARVHSAPSQQHGAHLGRPGVPDGPDTVTIPDEQKTLGPPLKR